MNRPVADRIVIFRDAVKYVGATYVGQVAAIFSSIALRIFLGTYQMGLLTGLQVIPQYASSAQLGVIQALEREIPQSMGRGDLDRVQRLRNTGFAFSLMVSILSALLIASTAFVMRSTLSETLFVGFLVFAAVALLHHLLAFYTILVRASKNFDLLAKGEALFKLVAVGATVVLAWQFRIYGIYALTIAMVLANLTFLYAFTRFPLAVRVDWQELRRLFFWGLPLFVGGLMTTVLITADRLIIGTRVGADGLGLYSIAILAHTTVFQLTNKVGIVLFPRMQELYGASGNPDSLRSFVFSATLILGYLTALAIGAVYIVLSLMTHLLLPGFVEGITSMKVLLLGTFFFSMRVIPAQLVFTVNKHLYALPMSLVSIILAFGLSLLFIKMEWGIEGVALAMAIAFMWHGTAMLLFAMWTLGDLRKAMQIWIGLSAVLVYAVLSASAVDSFAPFSEVSLTRDVLVRGSLQLIGYAVMMTPVLWDLDRRTGLIRHVAIHAFRRSPNTVSAEPTESSE